MNYQFESLRWDSDFFNLKVGKLELSQNAGGLVQNLVESQLRASNLDLIYLFSNVPLNFHFDSSGYSITYKGSKTLYEAYLDNPFSSTIDERAVSLSIDDYSSELHNLALSSGHLSRFRIDSTIAEREFEELYNMWLVKSLKREIADEVDAIMVGNDIAGFVTLQASESLAKIGLIAVAENHRGKGIGGLLLEHAKRVALEANASTLQVETQGDNAAANALYTKNGFKKLKTDYVCHLRRH
jgi:ribosomal protein S18 acetylase RimI-like enzyme